MSNIDIPNNLFEHRYLSPEQKWLYICLRILCERNADGIYSGSIKDLQREAFFHDQRLIGIHLGLLRQYGFIEMHAETVKGHHFTVLSIRINDSEKEDRT
jgi:hypothetical protein